MTISKNFTTIKNTIATCAKACGLAPDTIHLLAVSKRRTPEQIQDALDTGHRLFGENRLQEAQDHWAEIKSSTRYPDLKLHLIGPLQTNKVKNAVALFDVIETLDRKKLVDTLAKEMEKQARPLPCFIQVNTGAEEQKAGITPENLPNLLHYAHTKGLEITGLMCIPPADEPPALHFAFLKKLAARHDLPHLSMGMSRDFEKAIPLGTTHVRVGTALFTDDCS